LDEPAFWIPLGTIATLIVEGASPGKFDSGLFENALPTVGADAKIVLP
jgi:hypothetical protein